LNGFFIFKYFVVLSLKFELDCSHKVPARLRHKKPQAVQVLAVLGIENIIYPEIEIDVFE